MVTGLDEMKFGVFIYEGVEPIDMAAYGVISMARRIRPDIEIVTIAPSADLVLLASGLRVLPDFCIDDAPDVDVLIIAGGPGWRGQSSARQTLAWLRRVSGKTVIASICTGAMILAAAGLLDGRRATTKRRIVPPESSPLLALESGYRLVTTTEATFVDEGDIVTGGGVALCIDTTLHLLGRAFGQDMADEVARLIEYDRAVVANARALPPVLTVDPTANVECTLSHRDGAGVALKRE